MGKAKKKAAKKPAPKKRASAPARKSARKREVVRLSAVQKQRMHKPGADLDEIVTAFMEGLEATKRKVKPPGLTTAKLRSKLSRAEKAQDRLDRETAKAEAKLGPLRDQALLARHETWDLLLGGNKVKEAVAERHPDVREAFARFDQLFAERYKGGGTPDDGGGQT